MDSLLEMTIPVIIPVRTGPDMSRGIVRPYFRRCYKRLEDKNRFDKKDFGREGVDTQTNGRAVVTTTNTHRCLG